MSKNDLLIVIESPGKIKSFNKYVPDADVVASKGHVLDLPKKKIGVNLKDFSPTFEIMEGKESLLKEIIHKAKNAKHIVLLLDSDHEGVGISKNIYDQLPDDVKKKTLRATTNSITKNEIEQAIKNAYSMDSKDEMNVYSAYLARRVLDRIVGYRCSWICSVSTGGPSAGRVQSAAMRVIAEKEQTIKSFVPEIYWPIDVELLTKAKQKISAHIKEPTQLDIKTQKQANEIIDTFKKGPIKVSKYEVKNASVKPQYPFTTSSLQQTASSLFGWSSKKTMDVAQQLYQNGAISYHRTDSPFFVKPFIDGMRSYIQGNFDKKYLPAKENFYSAKVSASASHEGIRPTDISVLEATGLGMDEAKLYKMIWKRTLASQMSNAEYERRSAEFSAGKYIVSASGSKELFDGFRRVWDYSSAEDKFLPDLKVGDVVDAIDFKTEECKTSPPSRYSEGSFVKKLEELGIGRSSTYASTIGVLISRKYILIDKKAIVATDLGLKVVDFLVKSDFCFIDLDFTKEMEEKLDLIAEGKLNRIDVLNEFWTRLQEDLKRAKDIKVSNSKTEYKCGKCNGFLVKKFSKFGAFYSCENYKDGCDYMAIPDKNCPDGPPIEKVKKELKESKFKCEGCGEKLIIRTGKNGDYLGCRNWADAKCKGFYGVDGVKNKPSAGKKKFWGKKKKSDE